MWSKSLRLPGGWGSQISRKSPHEGGLSTVRTGRLYPQEIFDTTATVRTEGLCAWKVPVTPSGDRTRDLQTCSAVPQPTAPPRAPYIYIWGTEIMFLKTRWITNRNSDGTKRFVLIWWPERQTEGKKFDWFWIYNFHPIFLWHYS